MVIFKKTCLAVIVSLFLYPGLTNALDWPKKAIQIICPYAPGGDTDFNARSYIESASKKLGVDVVITATTGNGGAVGARKAKEAPADGYVVFYTSSALITNELSGAIDFGIEAFEFSCLAAKGPGLVVCVSSDLGVSNLKELAELTKRKPGELRLAADTGATTQIVALMLKNAGIDANIVDAGPSSERIAALLGGHVDIIVNAHGSIKDYVASGDFVALGISTDEQPKYIPDIPICLSQGFDVVFPSYFLFAFPKGTDRAIVEKWTGVLKEIAETDAKYAETIKTAFNQEVFFLSGEEGLAKLNEARGAVQRYQKQFRINN
ncbi:MAG: tripartite tricarboxylate transporter substrate binding protein [Planctomycetota bacterium]|jgi:tripartite-type tricarboxylate transporter receptor subunit TctC|nr:tripartite tricarboxylate transporter substrate binding protein [Planctomycetota bacterium]